MTNVHISLGNCTKRAFDKELRKIRMYGGRVTLANFGGKNGCSQICFDMRKEFEELYTWHGKNRSRIERENKLNDAVYEVVTAIDGWADKVFSPTEWRKFYRAAVIKALKLLR